MRVLDIEVPERLVARWRCNLAPDRQPFFVTPEDGLSPVTPLSLPPELHDTYRVWRMRGATGVVWLDEASFMAMPRDRRGRLVRSQVQLGRRAAPTVRRWERTFGRRLLSEQADGHRFVWWPSLVDRHREDVLVDQVQDGQPSSRHREVSTDIWRACRRLLPGVQDLAGTFSESVRANCFGTTIAAAGLCDDDEQGLRDRFEEFLTSSCTLGGGDDGFPGTVLVWRNAEGQACHSAVTIGGGWAFEKPSQTWWTPRLVLATPQLIRVNSTSGLRLERRRMKVG